MDKTCKRAECRQQALPWFAKPKTRCTEVKWEGHFSGKHILTEGRGRQRNWARWAAEERNGCDTEQPLHSKRKTLHAAKQCG